MVTMRRYSSSRSSGDIGGSVPSTVRIELPQGVPSVGDVDGKRVVVTGSGRGLGHVIAWAFSAAGAKVAVVARTASEIEDVASGLPGPSLALAGDVRDGEFNDSVVAAVVDAWGGVDVWIANAGISRVGGVMTLEPDDWRDIIDTNLTG